MTTIGKMADGRIVEVVRVATRVQFSADEGWVLIDPELGAPDMTGSTRANIKWYPASTQFEWVRNFNFEAPDAY